MPGTPRPTCAATIKTASETPSSTPVPPLMGGYDACECCAVAAWLVGDDYDKGGMAWNQVAT